MPDQAALGLRVVESEDQNPCVNKAGEQCYEYDLKEGPGPPGVVMHP